MILQAYLFMKGEFEMNVLSVNNLSKVYGSKVSCRALSNIQFFLEKGEFIGIMGPSGSGKTTLLNMVSTIDKPTSGEVLIQGENPHQLKKNELALFRRQNLGFVFQDFKLLDTLTIGENVILPLTLENRGLNEMRKRLTTVANQLGIESILDKRIFEVSGGQQQRAAIARAVIHSPSLILADEPTGNLDSNNTRQVLEIMKTINEQEKTTIMMVTHDPISASYCHRILFIKDGQLYNEIHRGDSRQEFYQKIVDALSVVGGDGHDISSVRI